MMQVKINGLDQLRKQLAEFSDRRFAAAIATALTRSGKHAQEQLRAEMQQSLDRPTPFTLNALHLAGACHITGWEPDKRGAYTTPRWTLGERADAARPKRVDHAAYQRARRKVIKLQAAGFRPPSVVEMARAAA